MAPKPQSPARLIALDGSRGTDITKSAERLAAELRERGITCVISRWDASGLFGELAQNDQRGTASVRTLSLVYAADLAFRLRWEISAALKDGAVVIAAPYVETAIAFGIGRGLPEQWLRELLRFAPAADVQALACERKLERGWKPRLDRSYPEYCAALLAPSASRRLPKKLRADVIATLRRARGRRVYQLEGKGLAQAVKAVTGNQPASSSQPSSRPRTARK